MKKDVKALCKNLCLCTLFCTLLFAGLVPWQQQILTAHASPREAANCPSPCPAPPDLYLFAPTQVTSYNGTSFTVVDDNNIGMTNGSLLSNQFGPINTVVAHGSSVYEVRLQANTRFIFQIVHGGCTNTLTGYCLTELDDNPLTGYLAESATGVLYQEHTDGTMWVATASCYHCWLEIDANGSHGPFQMVAGGWLYELRGDQTVWRYSGCNNCWTEIDSDPTITSIATSLTGVLYELREVVDASNQIVSASVLQGSGPFNFQALDTVHLTNEIVASSRLYQLTTNNQVLLYTGGNPSWTVIQSSTTFLGYLTPGVDSDAVYQPRVDGSLWRFTPEQGWIEVLAPNGFSYAGLAQPSSPIV